MKLYRIKLNGLFWASEISALPVWDKEGVFFTEEELTKHLESFKYQRGLWPEGAEVELYHFTCEGKSTIAQETFAKLDEELSYESLKGSTY